MKLKLLKIKEFVLQTTRNLRGLFGLKSGAACAWIGLFLALATIANAAPNLTVTQTVPDAYINDTNGQLYEIDFQNAAGADPAENLMVEIDIPENATGFSFVPGSISDPTPTVTVTDGLITLEYPADFELNGGDTLVLTYELSTNCIVNEGSYPNIVTVDYTGGSESSSELIEVLERRFQMAFESISPVPYEVSVGDTIEVRASITNESPHSLFGITLGAEWGSGMGNPALTSTGGDAVTPTLAGNTYNITIDQIPANATRQFQFTLDVEACTGITVVGTAEDPCDTGTPYARDRSPLLRPRQPNIQISTTDAAISYCEVGQMTVTIENSDPDPTNNPRGAASSFVLTTGNADGLGVIPDDFQVSNVTAGWTYDDVAKSFTYGAGDIPAGDTQVLSFDLTPLDAPGGSKDQCYGVSGDILFYPEYTNECGDPFAPDPAVASYSVADAPTLGLNKEGTTTDADTDRVFRGEEVTFTITPELTEPNSWQDTIVITDTILADFFAVPSNVTVSAGTLTWTPGTRDVTWELTPTEAAAAPELTITATVDPADACAEATTDRITNTANISATTDCGCVTNASAEDTFILQSQDTGDDDEIKSLNSSGPFNICDNEEIPYEINYPFGSTSDGEWIGSVFTDNMENQTYVTNSAEYSLNGTDWLAVSPGSIDAAPPTLIIELDFLASAGPDGFGSNSTANRSLRLRYRAIPTTAALSACSGEGSIISSSSLDLASSGAGNGCGGGNSFYQRVEVPITRVEMDLAISLEKQLAETDPSEKEPPNNMTPGQPVLARIDVSKLGEADATSVVVRVDTSNYALTYDSFGNLQLSGSGFYPGFDIADLDIDDTNPDELLLEFTNNVTENGVIELDAVMKCGDYDISATLNYNDPCDGQQCLPEITATDEPLLKNAGDLVLNFTPDQFQVTDDTVSWIVYVTNGGTGTAYNVRLTDTLEEIFTFDSATIESSERGALAITPTTTLNGTATDIVWDLGDMATNEVVKVEIIVQTTGGDRCDYGDANAVEVTSGWIDRNGDYIAAGCDSESTDSAPIFTEAPPALVVKNEVDPFSLCGIGRVRLVVTNSGDLTDFNINLTQKLENTGLTFVDSSEPGAQVPNVIDITFANPPGGISEGDAINNPVINGTDLVWTYDNGESNYLPLLEEMESGDTFTIEFSVKATEASNDLPPADRVIQASATWQRPCQVGSTEEESTTGAGFASPILIPNIYMRKDGLNLTTKQADYTEIVSASPGDEVQWRIRIGNIGDATAQNVRLEDTLPENMETGVSLNEVGTTPAPSSAGSLSAGVWSWNIPDIPMDTTYTYTINATISPDDCRADTTNQARLLWGCGNSDITSPSRNPDSATLRTQPSGENDVVVSQTATGFTGTNGFSTKGGHVTVTIENDGAPMHNVRLVDNIDTRFQLDGPITYSTAGTELPVPDAQPADGSSADNLIWEWGTDASQKIPFGTHTIEFDIIEKTGDTAGTPNCQYAVNITPELNWEYDNACSAAAVGRIYTDSRTETPITPLKADLTVTKTQEVQVESVGNNVTWTITVENTGTADATDAEIVDTVGNGFDTVTVTSTTPDIPAGDTDITGNVVTFSNVNILAGETQEIRLSANLLESGSHINSVTATEYGSNGTCEVSTATDEAYVAGFSFEKSLSQAKTPAYDDVADAPGEIVEYTITANFEGNDYYKNIVITDTLPEGLEYIPGSGPENVDNSVGDLTVGNFAPSPDPPNTKTMSWTLNDYSGTGTATITYQARIIKEGAAERDTNLPNDARASFGIDFGGTTGVISFPEDTPGLSDSEEFKMKEPNLTLRRDPNGNDGNVNAGLDVSHELIISNDNPESPTDLPETISAPAYELVVTDVLPEGFRDFDPTTTTITVTKVKTDSTTEVLSAATDPDYSVSYNGSSLEFRFNNTELGTLQPEEEYRIAYTTRTDDNLAAGLKNLTHTATINNYYSQPDVTPRRAEYTGDSASVIHNTVDSTISKTADPVEGAIGDTITYELKFSIPANTSVYDFSFSDTLPAGLEFVSGSSSGPGAGVGAGACATSPCWPVLGSRTPTVSDDVTTGETLQWYAVEEGLDIVNTSDGAVEYTIIYQARVFNDIDNQGAPAAAPPTTLQNTATYEYSTTDGGGTRIPNTDTATVTVIEPNLEISKTVDTGNSDIRLGGSIRWEIFVENTGDATAYQVEILDDDMPEGLSDIQNIDVKIAGGNVYLNDTATATTVAADHVHVEGASNEILNVASDADGDGTDTIQIDPGASITIAFDVAIADTLSSGESLTNEIFVPYKSQPTGTTCGNYLRGNCDGTDPGDVDDDDDSQRNNYEESASETVTVSSGKIGDFVWFDANNDGVQDSGEPGIPNVIVYLDLNNDGILDAGEPSVSTDANGQYLFTGLPAGNYTVRVDSGVPDGLDDENPTAEPGSLNVAAGGSNLAGDFGYTSATGTTTAVIGDLVWYDTDADGIRDAGEPGIGNVTLDLIDLGDDGSFGTSDDSTLYTTTTTGDGAYLFLNVPPGKYVVDVTDADGELGNYVLVSGNDVSAPINAVAGGSYLNADFGYRDENPTATVHTVTDVVWHDADEGGIDDKDVGEAGISNVTVNLVSPGDNGVFGNEDDTVAATALTDVNGQFTFTGVPDGDWRVQITDNNDKLQGYSNTTVPGGGRYYDVNMSGGAVAVTEGGAVIDVTDGNVDGVNFGYNRVGVIGDRIWYDTNDDGGQDSGEQGISEVTVALIGPGPNGTLGDDDDVPLKTAETDSFGNYLFTGIGPGDYRVEVTDDNNKLTGYELTGSPSDPDEEFFDITFPDNGVRLDMDFGYRSTTVYDVSGTVWMDRLNEDGNIDDAADEPRISGVIVELRDSNGNLVDTQTTDGNGDYVFTDVPEGDYRVVVDEDDPSAEIETAPQPPAQPLNGFGRTTPSQSSKNITVSGGNETDHNFGYVGASIGNYVWEDADGEGDQDESDAGIETVDVRLFRDANANGVLDSSEIAAGSFKSLQTDADGAYLFEYLPAGHYLVVVDDANFNAGNPLNGFGLTTANEPMPVSLSAGEDFDTADFGYQQQGEVFGHLFVDVDGDGIQQTDEPDLSDVDVVITDSLGNEIRVTSDENGNYRVSVPVGNTTVNVDETTLPAGYVQTAGTDPNSATVLAGQATNAGEDGYQPRGTVFGHIFEDENGNGVQDPGEPDLPGVDVIVTDFLGGTQTVATDADGNWSATVPAGETIADVVESTLPAGYVQTAGTDPTTVDVPSGSNTDAGDDGYRRQNARIGDFVWNDLNGNGIQDPGEPGIPDVVVYLDLNGNGARDGDEPAAVTDADDGYLIGGLPAGTYTARVDSASVPEGFALSSASGALERTLTPGETRLDADFGYRRIDGGIGDRIWNDRNGDGVQDADEPGIPGVTATLIDPGLDGEIGTGDDVLLAATTTGEDGRYLFPDLPAGTYAVVVTDEDNVLENFVPTTANEPFGPVELAAGENRLDADFGYRRTDGAVGDRVWIDANRNGVPDPGEPGIPNVLVRLLDEAGAEIATARTDIDGRYRFDELPEGEYSVEIAADTVPPGLEISTAPDMPVVLGPGEFFPDADFGYISETGAVGDTVWHDANGDGVRNPGEPGIGDVDLELIEAGPDGLFGTADDVSAGTATTAPDGTYLFPDLLPGFYRVAVTDADGVLDGYELVSGPDPSAPVRLEAGEIYLNADFGYRNPALFSISDRFWLDANGDGVPDPDEAGIPGVSVGLRDASGATVATALSDADGRFSFPGLPDGEYSLVVTDTGGILPGLSPTTPAATAGSAAAVVAGADVSGENFGYNRPGAVGDTVFSDADGDGIRGPGEAGISGVTLILVDPGSDGIPGTDDDVDLAETTSGPDGRYLFPGLPAGTYAVLVTDEDNVLDGHALTTDNEPFGPFDLPLGESRLDADFGYRNENLFSISNRIWSDSDANGSQNDGEAGISGVTVRLLDESGATVAETETDDSGDFVFPGLPPGTYAIRITDLAGRLDGYAGTTTPGQDGQLGVGVTDADVSGVDFGYVRTFANASVGDFVWDDQNGDGVQDADEPGIFGVTVLLTDPGPDGELGTDDDIPAAATETDAAGRYRFADLAPGNYRVSVDDATLPAGFVLTGGVDPLDVSLAAGENFLDADFGYQRQNARIGDFVWNDLNGNGVADPGEPGISGVTLFLDLNRNGRPDSGEPGAITDVNGRYVFSGLVAGNYRVSVVDDTLPDGFVLTGGVDPLDVSLAAGQIFSDADFGYRRIDGAVGDLIWNDLNGDGIQDADEPGIPGVTAALIDPGPDGEIGTDDDVLLAETETDADGRYLFPDLPAGTYAAVVTDEDNVLEDFALTTANESFGPFELAAGENRLDADFGYRQQNASIGDFVWNDRNGDGVQDADEPGISGVTAALIDPGPDGEIGTDDDVLLAETETDADGRYLFPDLPAGTYAAVVTDEDNVLENFVPTTANESFGPFELAAGENRLDADFGYRRIDGAVGDRVWIDANRNGVPDPGEPGVPNVLVRLLDETGAEIATASTDIDGRYRFDGLPEGEYSVEIAADTVPPGLEISTAPDMPVALGPGEFFPDADFGYISETGAIGDTVWHDADGDGVRNPGEPGIGGVVLELMEAGPDGLFGTADDVSAGTATTAADGTYLFPGLLPGFYRVAVADADGVLDAYELVSGPDPSAPVRLEAGEIYLNADFGYRNPALFSISDRFWLDANGDGVPDPDEAGIPGVSVGLRDASGATVATALSDADGRFSFPGLPDGEYSLVVTDTGGILPGLSPTTPAATAGSAAAVVAGADVSETRFGYNRPGVIGDTVWNDADGNGAQEAGEAGIAGVEVRLYRDTDGDGNFDPDTDERMDTATTDINGVYRFATTEPGAYFVGIDDTQAALDGFAPTTADDFPGEAGHQIRVVLAAASDSFLDADFGYRRPDLPDVSGTIWNDRDANATAEDEEPPFPGVTVRLTDGSGRIVAETTTDPDGFFRFPDVPPGDYLVTVTDLTGELVGFDRTTPAPSYPISVTDADIPGLDFGFVRERIFGCLGDRVWRDDNGDGIEDPDEPGLPGVRVFLDTNDNGQWDPDEEPAMVTDENGFYRFTGLPPGDYVVRVESSTVPAGYVLTGGSDPRRLTLVSGQECRNSDFGYQPRFAAMGDRVWLDLNENGVQEPDEIGVSGVRVRLLDETGDTVLAETVTDGSGTYRFDGLSPGTYRFETALPEGFVFTTPEAGTGLLADVFDSDVDPETGRSGPVVLEVDEWNPHVDAGLVALGPVFGAIGDRVWYDLDGDGIQDPDESGVSGAVVRLLDAADGATFAETVSDGLGRYRFDGLAPGQYVVEFVPPAGYVFSAAGAGDDPALDSDPDPATGRTGPATLPPGADIATVDAGLRVPDVPPALLGDRVWLDTNENGVRDPGEPGVSGVTVVLMDGAAGAERARIVTDAEGAYRFEGLPPGDYRVRFVLPEGYAFAAPGQGDDPALDSDPDPATGEASVSLAAGEARTDMDAGLMPDVPPLTIGDLVWVDADGNGLPDPGEGRAGVRLTLQGADGNVLAETVTGAGGDYAFTDLPPGDYRVTVDSNTLPAGVVPISDPDGGLDNLADVVNLSADRLDVDFGYGPPVPPEPTPPPADLTARLGDRVWEDLNGDGIQDDGEPGFPGVTVRLHNAAGTVTLAETVTDAAGRYVFFGLTPGSYQVEFVRPSGYAFAPRGQAGANRDSNPDPETGRANASLSPGSAVLDVDAGLVPTQRIVLGDFVWVDNNGNGLPDADEGLGGVRVVLTDGTGAVIAETVTDGAGGYRFPDLPPGDYGVRVDGATLPEGLEPFVDPEGPADGAALLPNQDADNLDVDFGYRPAGPAPDLTGVVKVAVDLDGGELLPGDEIAYAVTLRNEGAGAAREVVYVDTPDPFSRLVPGSVVTERGAVTLGNGPEDFSIRVEVGTLEPGESVRVSYRVIVAAEAAPGSWIVNQGMLMAFGQSVEPTEWPVSAPGNDPTVIGPIPGGPPAPSMAFAKSAVDLNGPPLRPGDVLEYALTVRNDGAETATGLMLFDGPPVGTTFAVGSATADRGTVVEGNPIEWMVGELGPGEVFQGRFQATVNADISEGALICNRAILLGDGGLWRESLGPDGEETCLPVAPADGAVPAVRAVKRAIHLDGGNLSPGDRVGYRVTLINPADVPAEGVVFSDPMNGRAALIPGSVIPGRGVVETGNGPADAEVRVSVGTMAPGERVEIALEARISPDAADGEIIPNQGRVEWAGGAAPAPTDDPATATPDDPTDVVVVQPGGERIPPRGFKGVQGDWPLVSWTLRYENDDERAMVLHVEDPMPEGARIVADSVTATFGTTGVLTDPERVVWDGVVPAGGAVEIGYRVRVNDGVFRLDNQACAIWDRDGDGLWTDEPEAGTDWICTDDPTTPAAGDPTVWTSGCELSLGDRVWIDTDADGVCRFAEERSPDGVRLSLYRDADGDNRYTPGVDPWIAAAVTETRDGVSGVYRFADICPGDYIVGVDPSNFGPGGVLEGMRPTAFGGDPDNDRDDDSNGEDWGELGVFSLAFTLTPNLEPVGEDGDPMSNLTVDFGFLPPPPAPEECPACGPFKPF